MRLIKNAIFKNRRCLASNFVKETKEGKLNAAKPKTQIGATFIVRGKEMLP